MSTTTSIAILLAVLFTVGNAVPYSKYGRSCKDIGCRSDEVCVMAEDPCTYSSDSCGRYPTCQKSSNGGESCTTKICPSGQYCKTENGRPTCVNTTPGLAFDSAGISSVNGHSTHTNNLPSVPADPSIGSRFANSNPYANANAPPAEDINHNHNQPSYSNNNPGYPPYPANNNNGYPPYPINNNNNHGYPSQPNYNRPNATVDQYGYPIYPPAQPPSRSDNRYHNTYPQHNMPQHSPGWNNAYPHTIYSKNGVSGTRAAIGALIAMLILREVAYRLPKLV